ncbi:GAF domain-containing protein [Hymenobacter ruricola]|uniref:GAF domain-containing protein n=1 Tax=Hymenobacter ruricola TaxID=2791023 RepID=A0ABS0I4L3_9BACT|nr:GAF domain-containing protein [Hymenobacter ruricola]MBF9221489.1 GAF domain-containing protein [Hymenobacter ruricola]
MSATPAALLPEDEPERLRSLRAHEVLPTLIEPVFEEFVALTAQVFSLPISLIAVVEEDDVYYPANHGMPGNDQQPRVEALCSTAVQQSRAVVYHDLLLESTALTPEAARAAKENELRFYAGALLQLPNQPPLGTLCIIDRQPRTLSAAEQQLLEQLAALVSQAIAVRVSCLGQPTGGLEQWDALRSQLQEELRELTALVRYLFTRHGVQVPVPAELLSQVARRLNDIKTLLDEYHRV